MSVDINIPGYEILELIGNGGMSSVYRARQVSLDRDVAIKVMSTGLTDSRDFETRFMREAKSLAQLSHPNILTIFDVGIYEHLPYIATEYLPGTGLEQKIREGVDSKQAISITHDIAQALSYAHNKGFVHRDIKPSNILFSPDGTPVLVDFGIALNIENQQQLTQVGTTIGTPSYTSPEQARGEPVDPRSDLYSLGIVLYEMLTGELPFRNSDPFATALMHLNAPIPTLPPELSILQPIIDGLLAKSPEDRIERANDVVSLLNQLANNISGESRQPYDSRETASNRAATKARSRNGLLGSLLSLFARPESGAKPTKPVKPAPVAVIDNDEEASDHTMIVKLDESLMQRMEEEESANAELAWETTSVFQAQGPASGGIPVALTIIESTDPNQSGRRFDLNQTPFVVGRDESADLSIPSDALLSRKHFRIEQTENGFHIMDLSTNGVFVNGRRLIADTPEPLLFGDSIQLSKTTSLKFNAKIDALPDLTGTLLANRYRLTKQIHSSIKASTFTAFDENLPRTVAIKLFSPSLAKIPHYAQIFRQQAEIAVLLAHPHIAKVLDTGTTSVTFQGRQEDMQYLCMEHMPGGNLSDKVPVGSPLELQQALEWLTKIVGALEYAHAAGYVHSGLKPSAIVFDHIDNPYVADFALASHNGTETGSAILGSPAFIAPEQWENEPLTPAADQYSLAVLTYFMLSGSLPFEGQNDPEVRRRNYLRPPIPVNEEAARNGMEGLPSTLSLTLNKALSVQPNARYESVSSFLNALIDSAAGKRKSENPRAFISYHRETSAGWAVLFGHELKDKYKIDAYVDTQTVDQATRFPERVANAIADSDVFICLLGQDTLKSNWVREEIRVAHEHKIPMVPVFQERFEHTSHGDDVPPFLQALLTFDGVHLLDQRNIHIEHSIGDLARIIHKTADR